MPTDNHLNHQKTLIAALKLSLGAEVEVVETHISWILLAGNYAYKIKKSVNLGFLDFSTLEKRHCFCTEERRLNRRLAPDLYLDIVPIGGTPDHPLLNDSSPAIEYAVKMRRFSESNVLDHVLNHNKLTPEILDHLARRIADFHDRAATSDRNQPYGLPEIIYASTMENFSHIRQCLKDKADLKHLKKIEQWSEQEYQAHIRVFKSRKTEGFIRECHGDLHLGNIVLLNGKAIPFDCIEFSEDLRWIDVISEVAFLVMGLQDHNRPDLARHFLNHYLEQTGDYEGLSVLRFYLVYRAMVRAKITCIRAAQEGWTDEVKSHYRKFIMLAESLTSLTQSVPAPLFIAITYGPSGSGKTTLSQALIESMDLFRIRSDVERKRLYGLKPEARSIGGQNIYSQKSNELTHRRLAELAKTIIQSGYPVIVDATFLKESERTQFQKLAEQLKVGFVILECTATNNQMQDRVERRRQNGNDASEADISVLENQLRNSEPLTHLESQKTLKVSTEQMITTQTLKQCLEKLIYR